MIKTANVNHPQYKEAEALHQLLQAASMQLEDSSKLLDTCADVDSQFTITVGGQSVAFTLGGPQFQALFEFAKSIAAENGYAVDNYTLAVTE